MTEKLLLATSDNAWAEALQLAFAAAGITVWVCSTPSQAVCRIEDPAMRLDAVVVDQRIRAGREAEDGGGALAVARAVRAVDARVPILFLAPLPFEDGNIFAREYPPADVLLARWLSADVVAQIRESLAIMHLQETAEALRSSSAAVEIEISDGALKFEVRLGSVVVQRQWKDWAGRMRLAPMARKFQKWRLYQAGKPNRRPTDHWEGEFAEAGEVLENEFLIPQSRLLENCWKIDDHENIHFRFTIGDKELIHVPFELIRHSAANAYIREISPVARRLRTTPANELRRMPSAAGAELGRVLFVGANVEGPLAVPGCTFGGSKIASFRRLSGIEREWREVEQAYAGTQRMCKRLDLQPGKSLDQLEQELCKSRWDAVHFSGHSIRADDGQSVFLVLPGASEGGQLRPLPMRNFADYASQAGSRIIVLSSCESSSPEAITELAQYGASVVVGFRWEVLDDGAATFTGQLHRALAEREPVGRAFVRAIKRLMARDVGNPTFASPMLLMQHDGWLETQSAG